MMVNLDFYPLTVDYIDEVAGANRGIIRLFGRCPDGKRICVMDSNFSAYFWVIVDEKEHAEKVKKKLLDLKIPELRRTAYVTNVEIKEKKHLSKDVCALKVEVNNPKDVSVIREEIKKWKEIVDMLELDIPYVRRYLMDSKIEPLSLCSVEGEETESSYTVDHVVNAKKVVSKENGFLDKPNVLGFDIEVYSKHRFPNDEVDPILMIALYGNDGFEKTILWKKYDNPADDVEFVKDERELIIRFNDIVKEYGPDFLVGYFSDGFDFPYIKARADKYKIKLNLGLDGSVLRQNKRNNTATTKIKGISHIDVFKFIRRIMSGEINLPSYDLDTVASNFLGVGKTGADVSKLWEAWDKHPEQLGEYCKYNLIDSKLACELFEKIYPNLHEFVKLCGLPADDISRMGFSQLVESFVMKNLDEFNEIAPNRPYRNVVGSREGVSVEGAFVYKPEPGLYKDIVVFDFKSLYPTIISAHNICSSTITSDKKEVNTSPKINVEGKDVQYNFNFKYDGIFPKLIREILVRRNRVKELLKKKPKDSTLNARQYSLKTLANSSYGYLGFSGARWYCKECAASTTAYARDYIKKAMDEAEKEGLKVIYGDTDSVFIALGDKTQEDAAEFLKTVNGTLPSLMELEMDGYYPRGIFVMKKGEDEGAKKKYAMLDEKGKIKIAGFETVRGDWSAIAKETQKEVLKIILVEDDVKKAVDYVKNILDDVKDGKIDISKMVLKKRLTKDIEDYSAIGPHVNVAMRMVKRGDAVGAGSDIKYVVQGGKGNIGDKSVPADEAESYDAEYYTDNQIIPAVERIFLAVGYDKEDLTKIHKQKSLGDY